MRVNKTSTGVALALAAASLFAVVPASAGTTSHDSQVHCYGVNKCKGYNDCKTAHNACKGMGSCKGLGFVSMSAKACNDIGGKVGK